MKSRNMLKIILLWGVVSVFAVMTAGSGLCSQPRKVAVIPFVMNTQQDLTFLQKGIFDMFSSRIAYGDEVMVLSREELNKRLNSIDPGFSVNKGLSQPQAKKLGQVLDVDYVLSGSLTLFGNSMSLDVNMIDVSNNNPALSFFRQADEAGAVIPELDRIAEEINFKIFGRKTLEFKSQLALQKSYMENQNFQTSPLRRFQTLSSVKGGINSVAAADLDGDKKNEIVVINDHTVQIMKYAFNGKVRVVQTMEGFSPVLSLVSLDVADINNNGYTEIFITRINNSQQSVSSCVIEYNGSQYVKKKKTYPWYFRVVKDFNGDRILYAQEHSKKGPWFPKSVFRVDWQNNHYVPGRVLRVPEKEGFSVLSMTTANNMIKSDDSAMFLYTNQSGELVAFNDAGKIEWISDKGYGGSMSSYRFPKTRHGTGDHKYVFLQPRNIIHDMDGDGKAELFVIKNSEVSDYLFENTRVFKKGRIEILGWNDMGLSFEHAPKKLSGPVTDINIADYDNDSKMELLVTMIKKGGGSFSTGAKKSVLVGYELE